MKKWAVLALFLPLLSGCATAYDMSTVKAANAARQSGFDQCTAKLTGHANAEQANCILAVEKKWAVAIKLRNMGLYDVFAGEFRSIAVEADARRISPVERDNQIRIVLNAYHTSLREAYAAMQRENNDNAATLTMLGTGFLNGYNGARAATPAPVMTTCTQAPVPGAAVNCLSY